MTAPADPPGRPAFRLGMADEGMQVRVVSLRAGDAMDRQLTAMGLTPGAELTVRQRQAGGRLIVVCGGSRLALAGGMAHKVLVVPV
jgi:Fe2+ transport system protein FeoA